MNNLRKKMITFLFVLGLSISCSCIFTTNVKKVVAGESSISEISKDVLSVKCQISENTTTSPKTSKLRIVSTIDSLKYQSAGFDITYKGKEIPYNTTKVYQSIEAVSDGVEYNYSPNVFDIDSKYFITVTLINLQQEDYEEGILIKPYVVTNSGKKVYGTHRYVSVADALDDTVLNIPVEMESSEDSAFTVFDGNVSYNLEEETETKKSYYYDGTYTHFRIDTDRTAFKSVTSFTFSDGTNTGTATYRNLNNSYGGTANTADETWYDENSDYNVIATSADLYGFVALSVSKNFNLETIYLGADIVVNEGTSAEWLSNATDEVNTNDAYAWLPIATSTAFSGTFDGQGHTISGLYVNTSSNSQGLFAQTTDASTIQKLRMENSYFETTVGSSSTACIAAVSSKGSGTFDTIYVGTDVTIISGGKISGGIIGRVNNSGTATISNCWFAGSLNTAAARVGGIVGAVGADGGKATATISHCFNSGNVTTSWSAKTVYAGGICGTVDGTSSLTIKDCLNVGTITSSSYTSNDIFLGAILGYKMGDATYSDSGTYSTSDSCNPAENSGKVQGSHQYEKSEIKGFSGYNLSDLTFTPTDDSAAHWVVRANDTPALASLVDSAIRTIPSTTWHDEPESIEADGTKVYTISTLKDLYGFAKLSAEGQSFAGEKIQLGADIKVNKGLAASWAKYAPDNEWLPIGKTTPFAGTFDGQGHTISGVYVKDTNYVGLFAKTADDSMIRDVRLKNSYICDTDANDQVSYNGSVVGYGLGDLNTVYSDAIIHGERHGTGGLVGVIDGTGTSEIANCQFDGSIEVFTATAETRTGGIVGSLQADSATVTISHCLNTGAIHSVANSAATRMGGICGTVGGSCILNVNDCLVVGSLTADGEGTKTIGALTGQKGGSARINTVLSYASNDSYSVLAGQTITSSVDCALVEAANLVGELAYTNTYLEFDSPEKVELFDGHWTLVEDGDYPQLSSFATGEMIAPSYIKQNTRWYEVAEDDATEYTIYTAEELYGLAKLVNTDGIKFAGKTVFLGADLLMNSGSSSDWQAGTETPEYSWARIGNGTSKYFAGTFDGLMHTISGIYTNGTNANEGLFGVTSVNTTIQNLVVANSYIKGDRAVGVIAGQGGGVFDTIYVKEDVFVTSAVLTTNAASGRWCGGIIGILCPIVSGESVTEDDPNRISNCWFAGTLRAGRYGGSMAGSIGKHGSDTASALASQGRVTTIAVIEHCLNTGSITHTGVTSTDTTARTGGICGAIVSYNSSTYSTVTISDCLNIGTVGTEVASATNYGDIYGHVYGSTHITFENVYATDESCSSNGGNTGTTTTGKITRGFAASDIKGYDAYSLSLDYTNYWVARNGDTPVLGDFADTNVLVSADTAWYDEHTGTEDDKYIIDSVEELYGFAKLSYNENTFEDEIIYLGANIAVNSGNSSEWATVSPVNEWVPIGNGTSKAFAGTFDGQGYTISGLYVDGTSSNIGLFGCTTADASIKNLSIENTYFRGKKAIGAVAGQGGGTFDTIRVGSDVYLESTGNWCGGIIALIKTDSVTEGSSTDTHTINNCWFEGNIRTAQYGGDMTGSVGKYEDDTTEMTRYAGNLNITNCLSTGTITHTSETITTPRIGGFVGAVVSNYNTSTNEASLVSNLCIEDSISAGVVCSEIEGITKNIAAVTGHVFNGSEYTCVDVYATRECCVESNGVNSAYVDTTNVNVIRCYTETMLGFSGYVNTPGLVYDNAYLTTAGNGTWVAVDRTYPVLKSFGAEYTPVDFAPFVIEGDSIATMVDEGAGNAVITVVDTDETPYYQTYIEKIAGENGLGFVECYSNGETGLDNGAVYTSSYRKDDLVITVTYVANTKTTYISAGADVEFSPYLDENTVIVAGGNDTFGETSLGMLQLESDSGSTYIIQLENGHFIVHDGGQTETDYANFVSYLQELAGNTTPIIDAWIISHGHVDHYGMLNYVDADGNGICDDFYVEGVYFTEPSLATRETTGVSSSFVTAIRNSAKTLKTSTNEITKVYRMFTGQKYYFDGATMEVLLTHEQLTGYTDFNETSVWCKYTIGSDDAAKTFLNGADSSTMGMDFVMDVYSANYLYSDIFAALHHGINTSNNFTAYLKSNTIQNGYAADGAILYSRKSDPEDYTGYLTSGSSESENWLESLITDAAKKEIKSKNDTMNAAVYIGIGENKFFYYGAGTVKLNFTSDGITGGYIQIAE